MTQFSNKMQRGFSLITAIFLLVVLGTLGTLMVTFFAAQQQSSALDVMGSRAYQAARAGIEWAAYNVGKQGVGVEWGVCNATYAVSTTLFSTGDLEGTLSPFNVSLKCSAVPAIEGAGPGPSIWVYDITSTATYGGAPGNPDYVERVISVKMGR